jgi:hypothetical protein
MNGIRKPTINMVDEKKESAEVSALKLAAWGE